MNSPQKTNQNPPQTPFDLPPTDDEAERRVIACVLRQPSLVYSGDVKPYWFWNEAHRKLWRAVEDSAHAGVDADLVHADACYRIEQEFGKYEVAGVSVKKYAYALWADCTSPGVEFELWAPRVRSAFIRRQVIDLGARVSQAARNDSDGDSVVRELANEATRLAADMSTKRSDIRGVADDWFSIIERRLTGDGVDTTRIPTEIWPLDHLLGGGGTLGHYTVIMAQKKMGKSRISTRIAYNVAMQGAKVLHFSEEMTPREMLWLYVTCASGISEKEFWSDTTGISREQRVEIARKAKDDVAALPIAMFCGKVNVREIVLRTKAATAVAEGKPIVVIVDYLQRIGHKGEQEYERVTAVTMELAGLAKDSGAWVIALSQSRRTEGNKMPTSSDARSSGQIEQDVDEMVIYHRGAEHDPDASPEAKTEGLLWLCLNRHGDTGQITVNCDLAKLDFKRFAGYDF